jgi:hypothetical protein
VPLSTNRRDDPRIASAVPVDRDDIQVVVGDRSASSAPTLAAGRLEMLALDVKSREVRQAVK